MKVADLFAKLSLRPDMASFKAGDRLLGGIKSAIAGVLAFASAHFAKGMIDDVTELGGKIADMTQKIGVAAEPLQQLGYAASQSGSDLDGMGTGLKFLAKNADAATKGSKEQAAAFRKVGISARAVANGTLPLDEAFMKIADHFAKMPNGAAKSNLAIKLFGKQGADLIPLLNEGSEGIARMRGEFVELGGQMSGETASALEAFGDEQDKVGVAWMGMKIALVQELLPTLRVLVKGLLEWVKANRKVIAQKLAAVVKGMVWVMRQLASAVSFVLKVFTFFGDHLELTTALVLGLAGAFVILKFQAVATALASAATFLIGLGIFLLWGIAIAAIILVIQDLWSWINGGDSILKDLWEAFVKWLGKIWDHVVDWADKIKRKMQNTASEIVGYFTFGLAGTDPAGTEFGEGIENAKRQRTLTRAKELGLVDAKGKVTAQGAQASVGLKEGDKASVYSFSDTDVTRAAAEQMKASIEEANRVIEAQRQATADDRLARAKADLALEEGGLLAPRVPSDVKIENNITINGGDPNEVRKVVTEVLDETARHIEANGAKEVP
jgi:hypothetical protein